MGISTTIALFIHDKPGYYPSPMASVSQSWSEDQTRDIAAVKTDFHQTPALEVSGSSGFMAEYNEDTARRRQKSEPASSISSNESAVVALHSSSPSSISISPLAAALSYETDSVVDSFAEDIDEANDEEQEDELMSENERSHDSFLSDPYTQSKSHQISQDVEKICSKSSSIIWLNPDCRIRSFALSTLPLATIDYYTLDQRSRYKLDAESVPEAIVLTQPPSSTSRSSFPPSLTSSPSSFWRKVDSGYQGGLRHSTKPEQDKNFLTIPIPVRRSRKDKKKMKEEEKDERKKERRSRIKRTGQELEALLSSMEAVSLAVMPTWSILIRPDAQTISTSTLEGRSRSRRRRRSE